MIFYMNNNYNKFFKNHKRINKINLNKLKLRKY